MFTMIFMSLLVFTSFSASSPTPASSHLPNSAGLTLCKQPNDKSFVKCQWFTDMYLDTCYQITDYENNKLPFDVQSMNTDPNNKCTVYHDHACKDPGSKTKDIVNVGGDPATGGSPQRVDNLPAMDLNKCNDNNRDYCGYRSYRCSWID